MQRKFWTVVFLAVTMIALLLLQSCGGPPRPESPPGTEDAPGETLKSATYYAAYLASFALLFAVPILLWVRRLQLAGKVAGISVTILLFAPALIWLGSNLWLFSLVIGIVGIAFASIWAWRHREKVDDALDMDMFKGPDCKRMLAQSGSHDIVQLKDLE